MDTYRTGMVDSTAPTAACFNLIVDSRRIQRAPGQRQGIYLASLQLGESKIQIIHHEALS